jgi:hypothetical protein
MNVFNSTVGSNKYDYFDGMQNYHHTHNISQEALENSLEKLRYLLAHQQISYYHATLTEFNPETGTTTVESFHGINPLKKQIVINPSAAKEKGKVKPKKPGVVHPEGLNIIAAPLQVMEFFE